MIYINQSPKLLFQILIRNHNLKVDWEMGIGSKKVNVVREAISVQLELFACIADL